MGPKSKFSGIKPVTLAAQTANVSMSLGIPTSKSLGGVLCENTLGRIVLYPVSWASFRYDSDRNGSENRCTVADACDATPIPGYSDSEKG
eukprot:3885981-Rhodomonas_salina.3